MTKNYCDICGREIDTNSYYSIIYEKKIKTVGITFGMFPKESISCEQCWNNFISNEKEEVK